jgi:hypothetical protein
LTSTEYIVIIRTALSEQLGAAIKMVDNIIVKCPEPLWMDESAGPAFYKIVYHILYFIDVYLSRSKDESDAFQPRFDFAEDFGISKENFADKYWKKALSKAECQLYLSEIRIKAQKLINDVTSEELVSTPIFHWHGSSFIGSLIYNIRHIMLHIGALQGRLRMNGVEERFWVGASLINP